MIAPIVFPLPSPDEMLNIWIDGYRRVDSEEARAHGQEALSRKSYVLPSDIRSEALEAINIACSL